MHFLSSSGPSSVFSLFAISRLKGQLRGKSRNPVKSEQKSAEKDWNVVWKELVFYRDLVIVLYYSRAKLEIGNDANISAQG